MAEGVQGYPRWEGTLSTLPAFPTIAAQELRRAWYHQWTRALLTVAFLYAPMSLVFLQQGSLGGHTMSDVLQTQYVLLWLSAGVTATMIGPALLEDKLRGALELYYSRGVRRSDYLLGKGIAVFAATTLTVLLPLLLYYGMSFFVFDQHPDHWHMVTASALAVSVLWGLLLTGVGLGLASVARSSNAASLILLGGFAVLEIFVGWLLSGVTVNEDLKLASPFAAVEQQAGAILRMDTLPHGFDWWWGLAAWFVFTAAGWAVFLLKHPRMEGDERADR